MRSAFHVHDRLCGIVICGILDMRVGAYVIGESQMVEFRSITTTMGNEITGIDLTQPVSDADKKAIKDAFDEAGVLVFRGQQMTKQSLIDATDILGDLELHPMEGARDPENPKITIIAARGTSDEVDSSDGETIIGRTPWHVDLCYTTTPCRGALFYGCRLPPEGGETGFVDAAGAYDALDESMKERIDNLHVVQSWRYSMTIPMIVDNPTFKNKDGSRSAQIEQYSEKFPDVIYPLVTRHPISGRKVLNAPPEYASDIVELPGSAGWALLDEVMAHATQPKFIYWHHYLEGDVVAWDNWRVYHAAAGSKAKYGRLMWRTTIKGAVEFGRMSDPDRPATVREWAEPGPPLHLPV